ncbi:hypothetical protein [Virgibacillus oceani]|uniref:Uncharacterized protein n=1 Tax=Virgibacillus oceani TaxID=1479511 RepID=A0A917HSR9_9BACI|nr:hypothetical protein [Virgibacillus oceani]GGG88146.1 hypothetical protein GCM10011398_37650 [Virgibacillus oceani]
MLKLNESEMKFIRTIIEENNSIIELDNKHYYLSAIEIHESPIKKNDPETNERLEKKKLNLLNDGKFSIDEVVEMIDQGVL